MARFLVAVRESEPHTRRYRSRACGAQRNMSAKVADQMIEDICADCGPRAVLVEGVSNSLCCV